MNNNDLLWIIRFPETGALAAECGCYYCFDESDTMYKYHENEKEELDDLDFPAV